MSKKTNVFAEWGESQGYKKVGGAYVNDRGRFAFSYHFPTVSQMFFGNQQVAGQGYTVRTRVDASTFTKEATKELKRALKGVGKCFLIDDLCFVQLKGRRIQDICANMESASQILNEVFSQHGVQPKQTCYFCGAAACDDYIENDGDVYAVHAACRTQTAQALLEEVAHNQENGNYIFAILAAFVGGIIASLPSLITIQLGWYIGLLFMLIPLGAHFAYKKARGKLNWATPFLISIISLLCAFGLVIMQFYIEILGVYGPIGIRPLLALCYIFMDELIIEALMPLLFCFIGICFSWRQIGNENKQKIKQAQMLSQSASAQTYDDAAL